MIVFDAVKVILAMATLFAFGYGLTGFVAGNTALAWPERAGISFLLGTGAAGMVWAALMPFAGSVPPIHSISTIAWVVAGISYMRTTNRDTPTSNAAVRWPAIAFALLVAVEVIALTAASMRSSLGFDGLFNFEMKALIAFEHSTQGQIPLAFFSDESRTWSHLRYPLMVPFSEYWLYTWFGSADQSVAKIIFPIFYAALVCVVGSALRRLRGTVAALAAVAAMGTLPALTVIPGAISGYAEVPLAAAFAGAVACALIAIETREPGVFRLCGALLAVAAWTKAEGAILALCVAAIVLAVAGRRAWPVLALPVSVAVAWAAFHHWHGLPERDFPSLSPSIAWANINLAPTIVRVAARELVTPGHWGLLWPVFAVACMFAIWQRSWRDNEIVLAAVVIMPLCIYLATYLFSSWADVEAHVRTSFVRLLVPLAPPAIVFTFAQLWPRPEGRQA